MNLEVKVFKTTGEYGNLKAYAKVIMDDMFVCNDLKILDGTKGLWVAMPNRKTKEGDWQDIFHPISKEAREKLFKAVLDKYNEEPDGEEI